jgi:hypothetical protein
VIDSKEDEKRHAACMAQMRNAYKTLGGKSEGKRPVERPAHRR